MAIAKIWLDGLAAAKLAENTSAARKAIGRISQDIASGALVPLRSAAVLFTLSLSSGRANLSRLERLLNINAGALSFTCADLECRGLVSVERDTTSRTAVVLTDAGVALVEAGR